MNKLTRVFSAIERTAVRIGNTVLIALMLLVSADVFLRYLINKPLIWTHDVVSLYLMPAIFFLMLSDSFREGAQVRVDILRDRFPQRFRAIVDALGYLAVLVVVVLIGLGGWREFLKALGGREVVAGSIPWPVWPSFILVVIGSVMLVLRLAITAVEELGPDGGRADTELTDDAKGMLE